MDIGNDAYVRLVPAERDKHAPSYSDLLLQLLRNRIGEEPVER